jgi:hypothetical protein
LIFDVIGCNKDSRAARVPVLDADQVMPDEAPNSRDAQPVVARFRVRVLAATTVSDVQTLIKEMEQAGLTGFETTTGADGQSQVTIGQLVTQAQRQLVARTSAVQAPAEQTPDAPDAPPAQQPVVPDTLPAPVDPDAPVTDETLAEIDKLYTSLPVTLAGRAAKLSFTRELIGRYITTSREMTRAEAQGLMVLVNRLRQEPGCEVLFAEYIERPRHQQPPNAASGSQEPVAAGAHA